MALSAAAPAYMEGLQVTCAYPLALPNGCLRLSSYGVVKQGLALKEREWHCVACDSVHDRDANAAENIRRQGVLKLKAAGWSAFAHGGRVSPSRKAAALADEVGSARL
jgi:hypothetical protein